MIETEDVRLSQERLQALKELLSPIKDLARNWNVDINQELEKYMSGFEAGSDNFAEAALVIQGSAGVYGRKVELLYSLVLNSMDMVSAATQKKGKKGRGDDDEGGGGEEEEDEEEDLMTLDPVDLATSEKVRIDIRPLGRASHYRTRVPLCLTAAIAKRDNPENQIHDKRGELVANVDDFFSTTALVNKHGFAAFDIRSALFFHQGKQAKAMTPFFKRRVSQYGGFTGAELRQRTPRQQVAELETSEISITEPGDGVIIDPGDGGGGMDTTAPGAAPMEMEPTAPPSDLSDGAGGAGGAGGGDDGDDDDDGGGGEFEDDFGAELEDGSTAAAPPESSSLKTPVKRTSSRRLPPPPVAPSYTSKLDDHLDPYAELPKKPFKKGLIEKPNPSRKRKKGGKPATASLSEVLKLDRRTFRKPVQFPNILRKPVFDENIELFKVLMKNEKAAAVRLKKRLIAKPPAKPLPSDLLQMPSFAHHHEDSDDDDVGGQAEDEELYGTIVDQPDTAEIHQAAMVNLEDSQREALTLVAPPPNDSVLAMGDVALSYEDLVRNHVDKFTEDARNHIRVSELRERVLSWERTIAPVLEMEESAAPYDICAYSRRLINRLAGSGDGTLELGKLVEGGGDKGEVSRLFLTSLMLANSGNIQLNPEDRNCKLLSRKLQSEVLEAYVLPSSEPERNRKRKKVPT